MNYENITHEIIDELKKQDHFIHGYTWRHDSDKPAGLSTLYHDIVIDIDDYDVDKIKITCVETEEISLQYHELRIGHNIARLLIKVKAMKSRKGFVSNSSTSSFVLLTKKSADEIREGFIEIFKAMYEVSGFEKFRELSEEFDELPIEIHEGNYPNNIFVYDYADNGLPYELRNLIQEMFIVRGGPGYNVDSLEEFK